jgi:TPR repeat protein
MGDYTSAKENLERATEEKESQAHYFLAIMTQMQEHHSPSEVCDHMQKAAEGGFPQAQHNLGVMYLKGYPAADGSCLPKDPVLAKGWFQLASERGFLHSTFNLGIIEAESGNQSEAEKYFQTCIDAKHPQLMEDAQEELSKLKSTLSKSKGSDGFCCIS